MTGFLHILGSVAQEPTNCFPPVDKHDHKTRNLLQDYTQDAAGGCL